MRPASGAPAPLLWSCAVVAVACVALAIVIAGPYAQATVSAGSDGLRTDCGSTWDPAASTPDCMDALKTRSWTAISLLGVALFGGAAAVFVTGRWPASIKGHLGIAGAVCIAAVLVAGQLRALVIENTFGS